MKISFTQTEKTTVTKELRHQVEIEASLPFRKLIRKFWRKVSGIFF